MGIEPRRILVVGAGFAGSVYARTLADAGLEVHVIDKRAHIAGNAYDEVGADGIRIHRYGPHLFHTANERVISWVRRFGSWEPFTHRVRALLPGGATAPLPVNIDTVNAVFGTHFSSAEEVEEHLKRVARPVETPANAAEYLYSKIGDALTDLFFRPYTKKMWGYDLEEMSAAVVKRIPIRTNHEDTYFPSNDRQLLPVGGYTAFFESLLDHDRIRVSLDTDFRHEMLGDYDYAFLSMPIDEFYSYSEGPLPYRSIKFHDRADRLDDLLPAWTSADDGFSVLNYTDDGPFTRETAWHRLPGHLVTDTGRRAFTREQPCDYAENSFERYYPVKTADGANERTYEQYVRLAAADAAKLSFIGRCGTYRYLDMDQVINQSLAGVNGWISANLSRAPVSASEA